MFVWKRSRLVLLAIALVAAACGDDDDDNGNGGSGPGRSQLNEVCQSTADCAADLACLPFNSSVSVCRPVTADNVTPNNKECAAIECNAPEDCCENFTKSSSCSTWQASCTLDAVANEDDCLRAQGPLCVCSAKNYTCEKNRCAAVQCTTTADCCAVTWNKSSSCSTYKSLCDSDPVGNASACATAAGPDCVCSETVNKYTCQKSRCVSTTTCTGDEDCFSASSPFCAAGHCVQCKVDGDCPSSSSKCVANACVTPACKTNADCPAFSACQPAATTGIPTCVAVGCATDRECMTYEENYLAKCDTTATPVPRCVIQCDRDAQCASSSDPLRKCVIPSGGGRGLCQDPGCDTDEECKIRLQLVSELPAGTKAVCRERSASTE